MNYLQYYPLLSKPFHISRLKGRSLSLTTHSLPCLVFMVGNKNELHRLIYHILRPENEIRSRAFRPSTHSLHTSTHTLIYMYVCMCNIYIYIYIYIYLDYGLAMTLVSSPVALIRWLWRSNRARNIKSHGKAIVQVFHNYLYLAPCC